MVPHPSNKKTSENEVKVEDKKADDNNGVETPNKEEETPNTEVETPNSENKSKAAPNFESESADPEGVASKAGKKDVSGEATVPATGRKGDNERVR